MMIEHSPTPYRLGGAGHDKYACAIVADTDDGDYVAEVVKHPNWQANAEFLLRACNAHADLVAACKAVESHLKDTFPPYPDGNSPYDKVRAALAKAGGDDA